MTKSKTPPPGSNPSLQKFSKDATTQELLQLVVILYKICTDEDIVALNRFVTVTARIIGEEDFSKLLRRTVKMMGEQKCGEVLCSDWVMTKLFDLYKVLGV